MKEITYYEKVADLYNALNMPIEQDDSFTINSLLDIHKSFPYKSHVFRTNYYSFIFIKNGSGNYTTDEQTFEYDERTIYFTNPGHLKAFEFYELEEAYLITLSESFLKENVHQDIFSDFPFLLAETIPPQSLSEGDFTEVEQLVFTDFTGIRRYLTVQISYHRQSIRSTIAKDKGNFLGGLFTIGRRR